MTDTISPLGLRLIQRRELLGQAVTGLAGIALAGLLRSKSSGAAEPIRPAWKPDRPYAARPAHFVPKAKQILFIFCSGALSHLDTWDYKPELIKRHDQPLPNSGEKLVTFQGENGNLV